MQSQTSPIRGGRIENNLTQDLEAGTETPEAEAGKNQQDKVSKTVGLRGPTAIMTTIIAEIGKEIEDMVTEATGSNKETTPLTSRQEYALFLRRFH